MTRRGGIVYVVQGFPVRSQTFIQNELRELRARGIEPRVFDLYPPDGLDTTAGDLPFTRLQSAGSDPWGYLVALARVTRRHPIGVVRAAVTAASRPSRLQAHAFAKAILLVDALGDDRPVRVHAHFARASASAALLAARVVGARFSFTGHAGDLFQNPFDLDRKLRAADLVITVCDYNRARLEREHPRLHHVEVVPCGVRTDEFRRSRAYERDPFTIVAVGRLVPKKGFDDLLRACALLRDAGVVFRCRIIGDGHERPRLEALVDELGLGARVALDGAGDAATVREALEDASVFCLPSVIAPDGDLDSQPVVVKEAMAMEVPVVATREVGIPEMVDDRVGRLVPPRDAAALAAALQNLAALDARALRAMGAAGRRRVEVDFALPHLVGRLLGAWDDAVSSRRRG